MEDTLNLEVLRKQAGLSPTQMGHLLNLHPTQVLRYEKEAQNAPYRIVQLWLAACGDVKVKSGVDFGAPYSSLNSAIARLEDHHAREPELIQGDAPHALSVADAVTALRQIGRKPRLVLCGRFDAGKSRLINALMGADRLPSAYQPATRLICFVRHLSDKPAWQREDVWIFGEGFKPEHLDDQLESERYRLVAGDTETLARFNQDPRLIEAIAGEAVVATVYVDAPILRSCEFIDTPGLGDTEREDQLGKSVYSGGDAILYLAPIINFLVAEDVRALGSLLQALPQRDDEPALRRLFVLATHAHKDDVKDPNFDKVFNNAAERAVRSLEPAMGRFLKSPDTSAVQLFRSRIFPWYVEKAERRVNFENDLRDLLTKVIPPIVLAQADEAIVTFSGKAEDAYQGQIEALDQIVSEQEVAIARLRELETQAKEMFARLEQQGERVERLVARARIETQAFIQGHFAYRFGKDPDAGEKIIEAWIRSNFTDSEDAEEHAGNRILVEFEADIVAHLNDHSEKLKQEIEELLDIYAAAQDDLKLGGLAVPFDARAAFLGALAAGGTFGALSVWAATVAAGNNLGAWLLVPQVVSLLSRLGIGIAGGTATGVSLVSALGGPLGVGIGIAIAAGLLAWKVFGRSWQAKLAREIALGVRSEKFDLKALVEQRCDAYWVDTLKAFHAATTLTKQAFLDEVEQLRAKQTIPRDELIARRSRLERRRQYISFLPWTPLSEGKES